MGFKCGLVGLPNSGKSTIFNAITNLGVEASAYPFCTIDPHFGIVPLADARLDRIQQIVGSAKKTPTTLEFVDIAGLVKGAHQGEGLGNQFLSHIARVDAIAHVVRCFYDANVAHPYETLDPVRDARIVGTELILKDLEIVDKALAKTRNAAKSGDPNLKKKVAHLEFFHQHLAREQPIKSLSLTEEHLEIARELNLLTVKPEIIIANVDEAHLTENPLVEQLAHFARAQQAPCITFSGKIQAEIAELDPADQLEFLSGLGLEETGLQEIVRAGYEILRLVTFFTANENEAHAWTIPSGTAVQQAAAQVHTDFEKHFIKAEVVKFADLAAQGSIHKLHELGLAAIHGKDYVVQDGDLILFKV